MTTPTFEQCGYLTTLEDVANMLRNAQRNIKRCPEQRLTEGYLKARIKSIEDYWDTFKQAHNSLTRCTTREQRGSLPYFLKEEFYKFEEVYICLHADLTDLLLKLQPRIADVPSLSNATQGGQISFTKLPRIKLPTFSGKYEDWPSYEDLFFALVHNTSMSDVQKLHYLKTTVSGEAEILLRNIQITETNYSRAWDLLKARFGNKKMITNSIFKRLFGQKRATNQSANQIKTILDTTLECLSSLNNLKISTDSWDPIIIFLITQKLDAESLKDWEEQIYRENSESMPTWDEMKKFLEFRFRTLEMIAPAAATSSRENQFAHKSFHVTLEKPEVERFQSAHARPSRGCAYCKAREHCIKNCKAFIQQPVEERHSFVKNNKLCFNCLMPNHSVYELLCKGTCRICHRRHAFLLHRTKQEENNDTDVETHPECMITTAHFSREQPGRKVLLATAQVNIKKINGEKCKLRALIDQGSEASLISSGAVELLGVTKTNNNAVVSGVREGTQITSKHSVELSISSRFSEDKEIGVKAYVLDTVSTILPAMHFTKNWSELQNIQRADPTCFTPGGVDILLGTDVFSKIIEEGLIKTTDGIVAQKTCLGWIISGQQQD